MDGSAGYGDRRIAEIYDHIPGYQSRPDVNFYREQARSSGGPVLEVGCGTGRILLAVAGVGVGIVGLDASAAMLAVCRQKAEDAGCGVRGNVLGLEPADMLTFRLARTFAAVIVPFRTFQFLTSVDQQFAFLRNVHAHLEAGGRLAMDLFDFDLERPPQVGRIQDDEEPFTMPDGSVVQRVKQVTSWSRPTQTFTTCSHFEVRRADGQVTRFSQEHRVRYTFRFELEHLLARAGFDIVTLHGDFSGGPVGETRPGHLVLTARRS